MSTYAELSPVYCRLVHDNLCYLTINCDTGQHSQFLRCLWNGFRYYFSLQCGTASSCVKISRPTNMFDSWGRFVPPDQRRPPETLFRGCFVLDLRQDICYNARDGLRYCWCSSKDLCNSSPSSQSQIKIVLFISLVGQNVKAASMFKSFS